jgi:hypothetical protein
VTERGFSFAQYPQNAAGRQQTATRHFREQDKIRDCGKIFIFRTKE